MKDVKSLKYTLDILRALELQMEWQSKSDNPQVKELGELLTTVHFYINSLELDKMSLELERMELIKENAMLLSRAIKAEEELDKIKGTEVDFNAKINERIAVAEKLNNVSPKYRNGIQQTKLTKPKF